MFLIEKNLSIVESIKRCPKMPFLFNFTNSGFFIPAGLHMCFVYKPIIEQEIPPTLFTTFLRISSISLFTNLFLPIFMTSYVSHYVYMTQHMKKDPMATNFVDFFTLSYEYSRSVWRKIPLIIGTQLALAVFCTWIMHWGRKRFNLEFVFIQILFGRHRN